MKINEIKSNVKWNVKKIKIKILNNNKKNAILIDNIKKKKIA